MKTINLAGMKFTIRCFLLTLFLVLAGCGSDESTSSATSIIDAKKNNVNGTATLSWVAPTTRADSSPLQINDIDGYNVYMGNSVDSLAFHADINDPYQMEFIVKDLATGTYYFSMTAYDQSGAESDFSTIISKSI